MSYTTHDFSESLNRVGIKAADVETVIAAWGGGDGMGEDSGWSGGFLFRLKDGRIAYLQGWCDYTGWGCQDGAEVVWFDAQPALADVKAPPEMYGEPHDWDEEPADLNRWLASGAKDPYDL